LAYRAYAVDLLTGNLIDEIPFDTFSFTRGMSGAWSLTGSVGLRHEKVIRGTINPGNTGVYVERDSTLLYGGPVWTTRAEQAGASVGVTSQGIFSIFSHYFIRATRTYAAADQFFIARDLIDSVQSQADSSFRVVTGAAVCGVLRDRTYYGYERKNVAAAIEELSKVQNGFDFDFDVTRSAANVFSHSLNLSYPMSGTHGQLRIDSGVNAENVTWNLNAAQRARKVDALGTGDADSMLIATATDYTLIGQEPAFQKVTSYRDASVLSTVQAHADADLAATLRTMDVPEIKLIDHDACPIGGFRPGDFVTLNVNDGYIAIAGEYRLTSYTISVNQDGKEDVDLKFAPSGAFV